MVYYLLNIGGEKMRTQVSVDIFLDRLPITASGIIFTYANQGSSVSKIIYYVN